MSIINRAEWPLRYVRQFDSNAGDVSFEHDLNKTWPQVLVIDGLIFSAHNAATLKLSLKGSGTVVGLFSIPSQGTLHLDDLYIVVPSNDKPDDNILKVDVLRDGGTSAYDTFYQITYHYERKE